MHNYSDEAAQRKGEKTIQQVKDTVDGMVDKNEFPASPDWLFDGVGGKHIWVELHRALVAKNL